MTTLYNIDPARIDLYAVQGDAIDMEFYINAESLSTAMWKFYVELGNAPATGVPFYIYSARLQVRRKDGLLIKDWYSGVSPADIVLDLIFGGYCHLTDINGFGESGFFDYDLQFDNGYGFMTVMSGTWKVKKQITIP
jgi:hypothetical protein